MKAFMSFCHRESNSGTCLGRLGAIHGAGYAADGGRPVADDRSAARRGYDASAFDAVEPRRFGFSRPFIAQFSQRLRRSNFHVQLRLGRFDRGRDLLRWKSPVLCTECPVSYSRGEVRFSGRRDFRRKGLEEQLKLLNTDYTNIARVIATNTGRTQKQVVTDMNKQTSLMPENAKEYGLVHHIRAELIPAGAGMSVIYEDGATFEYRAVPQQQTIPLQQAMPPVGAAAPVQDQAGARGFTGQYALGYTQSPMSFTGDIEGTWDSKNYSSIR